MIETNPFPYFLPKNPRMLIVGSFPCFNGKDYGNWFYSGSGKNHFWNLLSDIFNMPAVTREQKIKICEKHKIGLTDIAYKIKRTKNDCSDAGLKIIEFNDKGIANCLDSGIKTILFTSRFVEKHFKLRYPDSSIMSYILLSPSPAANMHIGGLSEFKEMVRSKAIKTPYDYRLLKYRTLLLEQRA